MDMMQIRRDMMKNMVFLNEYTATGNPLSFETNVAKPLKSLVVPFTPVQEGTGDPSPTNVRSINGISGLTVNRTGKNLFDKNDKSRSNGYVESAFLTNSGSISSTSNYNISEYISIVAGSTYCLSNVSGSNPSYGFYDKNKNYISGSKYLNNTTPSFTAPNNAFYLRFSIPKANIDSVQLELGATASSYTPYSGTTIPVTFLALGKNLFDMNALLLSTGTLVNGVLTDTVGNLFNAFPDNQFIPGTTYNSRISIGLKGYCSDQVSASTGRGFTIRAHYNDGTTGTIVYFSNSTTTETYATGTSDEGKTIAGLYIDYGSGGNNVWKISEIMVVPGTTPSAYEPYTNTCYGGSLDVATGALTVGYFGETFVWGSISGANLTTVTRKAFPLSKVAFVSTKKDGRYCDKAKFLNDLLTDSVHFYISNNNAYVFLPIGTDETETVQVVYNLATPITYQLTPAQITSLIGTNTIWSDTNGTNTVKYLKKG